MAQPTQFDLHVGDCVAGMKNLPDESIDIVVTSPPYNLGISYQSYNDKLSSEDYLSWSLEWAGEVKRLLKPDGSFFLNLLVYLGFAKLKSPIQFNFSNC